MIHGIKIFRFRLYSGSNYSTHSNDEIEKTVNQWIDCSPYVEVIDIDIKTVQTDSYTAYGTLKSKPDVDMIVTLKYRKKPDDTMAKKTIHSRI